MKPVKLSRSASHRTSVIHNLATSLVLYERVQTTPIKARAMQMHTERLITLAKRWAADPKPGQKLALYRRILTGTADELAAKKLIDVLAARFEKRVGGYTRRRRLARRLGDGAEQVLVTLTDREVATTPKATPAEETK